MKKSKISSNADPMGSAILDHFRRGTSGRLRVFSPMFDEDEIPVATLFRDYAAMPEIERAALDMAKGRVLDVGAGAGCHSLVVQARGLSATAIDISPLSVRVMRERGIMDVREQDFFAIEGQFDTILMLMNGIGIVGTLDRMPDFFMQLDKLLAPGGQLLCDSTDICYVFETEDGIIEIPADIGYYGELSFRMQYENVVGESFPWLYIDAETLTDVAAKFGYAVEIVAEGDHYDFLARITKI